MGWHGLVLTRYNTRELLHCRSRPPLDLISWTAPVCREDLSPTCATPSPSQETQHPKTNTHQPTLRASTPKRHLAPNCEAQQHPSSNCGIPPPQNQHLPPQKHHLSPNSGTQHPNTEPHPAHSVGVPWAAPLLRPCLRSRCVSGGRSSWAPRSWSGRSVSSSSSAR